MAPDRDHQDAKHQLGLSRVRRVLGGALAFGCFCLKCRGFALFFSTIRYLQSRVARRGFERDLRSGLSFGSSRDVGLCRL